MTHFRLQIHLLLNIPLKLLKDVLEMSPVFLQARARPLPDVSDGSLDVGRGERGSKFESSQQILAGILFIIVWWPGKDIPQRSRAKGKGVVIDRALLCQHVRNGGLIPVPALRNHYPPLLLFFGH